MDGDEHVRHCGRCDKNVYNLSTLTREQAEALLVQREGELCVRFYRRPDGTVMTSDCAPGKRRRQWRGVAFAAAVAVGATGAAVTYDEPTEPPYEVMGQLPMEMMGEVAFEVDEPLVPERVEVVQGGISEWDVPHPAPGSDEAHGGEVRTDPSEGVVRIPVRVETEGSL